MKYQDYFDKKAKNQKINELRLSLIIVILAFLISYIFRFFGYNIQMYLGSGLLGAGIISLIFKWNNGELSSK